MRYFIGTSGWQYADWKGKFYPENLTRKDWLGYYAQHFPTLEINSSFYHLPQPKALINWYETVPRDFVFSLKVSRYITHIKRLHDAGEAAKEFVQRAVLLKEKLGCLLYQLPPGLKRNDELLQGFLAALPRGFRHVMEFRHPSWFAPAVEEILHNHGAGFCIFDMPELTSPLITTAGFGYVRFHGSQALYSSLYSDSELKQWSHKLQALSHNVNQIFIYFNNDIAGFALDNASTLNRYLNN